jgi:hypothetical protein
LSLCACGSRGSRTRGRAGGTLNKTQMWCILCVRRTLNKTQIKLWVTYFSRRGYPAKKKKKKKKKSLSHAWSSKNAPNTL